MTKISCSCSSDEGPVSTVIRLLSAVDGLGPAVRGPTEDLRGWLGVCETPSILWADIGLIYFLWNLISHWPEITPDVPSSQKKGGKKRKEN